MKSSKSILYVSLVMILLGLVFIGLAHAQRTTPWVDIGEGQVVDSYVGANGNGYVLLFQRDRENNRCQFTLQGVTTTGELILPVVTDPIPCPRSTYVDRAGRYVQIVIGYETKVRRVLLELPNSIYLSNSIHMPVVVSP